MATFSFYQDVKVIIWARQRFNIEAETYEEALKQVEKYKTVDVGTDGIDADVEWLFDTWEPIDPVDNADNATIELYDNGNVVPSEGWSEDKLLGTNALQSDAEESSDDEYSDADFSDYDEYTGHCWDCTREDFESNEYANYDLSGKSDEEIHQMIDEVVDMMQNDYVSEMYWQCINDVAEAHGLTKKSNENKDE